MSILGVLAILTTLSLMAHLLAQLDGLLSILLFDLLQFVQLLLHLVILS